MYYKWVHVFTITSLYCMGCLNIITTYYAYNKLFTGPCDPTPTSPNDAVAGFCLTLPGKTLYLKALLAAKKFRNRGNKEGALAAFYQLEEEGLGTVLIVGDSASKTAQVLLPGFISGFCSRAANA